MFRKFFRSPYTKAGGAFFASGILLIIVHSWLSRVHFAEAIAKFNDTMMPIYIGIFLAFLLCPIYNKIVREMVKFLRKRGGRPKVEHPKLFHGFAVPAKEKKPDKTPLERALTQAKLAASITCLLLIIIVLALFGYFVIPQVIGSIVNLINTMPQRLETFAAWSDVHLRRFPEAVDMINNIANAGTAEIIAWIQEHILKDNVQTLAETISNSLIQFVMACADAFVGLLIAVYLLNYKERLLAIAKKLIAATCTEKRARSISEFGGIINETFISFIVGRIIDGAIVGVMTYFLMAVMEMPLATLISVIVGVTNIIPFFGPFIGAIPSFLLLLLEDPMQALYFLIMILIVQQVDGNVIGPKIVGNRIGISSFWVLIAVLVGGGLFGFLGMALGVPVFAVFYRYMDKITINKLRKKEKQSETEDYLDYSKYDIEEGELHHE